MRSRLGEHEVGEPGIPSANLAAELRRLIVDLDAERYPEREEETQTQAEYDELQRESLSSAALIQSLKSDLEESNAELLVMVRLLQEFVRTRHGDLLEYLARMEQSLQDEINLMEKRIRGDIAALRSEFGNRPIIGDADDHSGPMASD